MELLEVKNPVWSNAEHTMVDVEATFDTIGTVLFTAHPTDGDFGPIIYEAAIAGDYGPIREHVAITRDPVPDEISRRQFFQRLAVMAIITNQDAIAAMQSGAIPAPLQAIIDDLPTEAEKFEATMLIVGADSFQLAHPLTEVVRLKMGWTEEQRNNFFQDAAKL